MKKSIAVFIVIAVALLSISAVLAADVEVTWWHTFTEGQEAILQEIIAEFNEANPGIKVIAESQPYDGFLAKVYEAVSTGTGPDIIFNYASTAADYIPDGLIVDQSKYMESDYKARVSEGIYAESTGFEDGGLYAVAVQSTGPILFYNKTMFDKVGFSAPKTWDEVEEAAKAIYAEYKIPGFAFDSLTDGMQAFLLQGGGKYVDLEKKTVLFNTPEFVASVDWYAKGVREGYFGLAPTTGNYFSNDMSARQLAAYAGSSAGLPYLNLGDDELAAAPLPQTAGGTNWAPAWTRSALVFASDEETERAAVKFVEYFTNPENAGRWAEAVVAFTPYNDTAELDSFKAFVSGNIALTALSEQAPYAYALPSFTGANTVRDELKALIEKVATDQMSAADAVSAAEATSNAAMQE